jgi:hypothetical protein
MIARLGLERTEELPACIACGCPVVEARRAATSYTTRGIYIKQISRLVDLRN